MNKMNIYQAFSEVAKERTPFFGQYAYNRPLIMSLETFNRTRKLGKILSKVITYFAVHYREYTDLFPLDKRDLEVLKIASKYPFKVGTFRTDFVLTPQKKIKIIEMTTRYPLNSYFTNGYLHEIAKQQALDLQVENFMDLHPKFLEYFWERLTYKRHVVVIKGRGKMTGFNDYSQILPLTDVKFDVIELDNLPEQLSLLEDANIIGEWTIEEIKNLPDAIIDKLCSLGIFNDFRNLFLVHDKRFYVMLSNSRFLNDVLTLQEQALLSIFTFPSYIYDLHKECFEMARKWREGWILKPYRAGKSEGVVAGCLTSAEEWEALFKSGAVKKCILQPMQPQLSFNGAVGDEIRLNNSLTGTLLYFDDEYFGPGMYRASSAVVCFQGDDRRIPSLVAQRDVRYEDITI